MDALISQFSHPVSWLKLGFTLLVGYAVWRIVAALLALLTPHVHLRIGSLLRRVWALLALYGTAAAAAYELGLAEVPLLYDHGAIIAQGFRASSGQVVLVAALAFIAWNLVTLAARRIVPDTGDSTPAAFTRRNVRVQTLTAVTQGSLRLVIIILTGISVLQALGVNATALLAGVSVLGLAVGFGAQSLIKDVFTGFFILLEDQYGVGDIIRVNSGALSGTVERLTLRLTVLRALDGTVHLVPNGQVLTVSVSSKDWSQVLATFTVPGGADVNRALEVMAQVANDLYADPQWQQHFLSEPEVQGVTNLTSDGTELRALLRVLPKSQFPVGHEFNRRIRIAMDNTDLGVPGPAPIEVRISQDSALLAPAPALDITRVEERQMDDAARKTDPPR
ncbi:mechanosensitive ion channel family protein [Deinococcus sp.]|uniref:mechanosensitive ion channel family protein n=1 Tax=Deinococcus sp. TaxID=47478 RepID=UPI003C7D821D